MFCQVVFDVPLDRTFDYAVPPDLQNRVRPGVRVTAPFGPRLTTGLVVKTADSSAFPDHTLIKEIACVLDEQPVFGSDLFALADFIKRTWGGPIGQILFALVPPQAYFKLAEPDPLPQQGFIPPVLTLNKEQTTVFEHLSAQLNAGFHRVLLSGADNSAQCEVTFSDGVCAVVFNAENSEIKELRTLADNMADKNKGKVVIITTEREGKKSFVVKSCKDGADANKIAKAVAGAINGRGGGKAEFAQGGGECCPWEEFLKKIKDL